MVGLLLTPKSGQYVPNWLDYQSVFHGIAYLQDQRSLEDSMKILHIDSSILADQSASRLLTRELVSRLKTENPDAEVQYLDLAAQALPHLTGGSLAQADATEAACNAQA